jgi:hypothetical protein
MQSRVSESPPLTANFGYIVHYSCNPLGYKWSELICTVATLIYQHCLNSSDNKEINQDFLDFYCNSLVGQLSEHRLYGVDLSIESEIRGLVTDPYKTECLVPRLIKSFLQHTPVPFDVNLYQQKLGRFGCSLVLQASASVYVSISMLFLID